MPTGVSGKIEPTTNTIMVSPYQQSFNLHPYMVRLRMLKIIYKLSCCRTIISDREKCSAAQNRVS